MARRQSFSEREGLASPPPLQVEGMDESLRVALWNVFYGYVRKLEKLYNTNHLVGNSLESVFHQLWDFLGWPLDGMPWKTYEADKKLKKIFLEEPWYAVYDFIDLIADTGAKNIASLFTAECNVALEQHVAAYRFVDGRLTRITSEEEITSLNEALEATEPYSGARAHLKTAFEHLSRRSNPDFRNSVKESISALESMCQVITENPKASLGEALNEMERNQLIHPALKSAFSKLYGYTSNADGIRHAMLDEANLTFVDAKFMAVACTAFINYIIGKSVDHN